METHHVDDPHLLVVERRNLVKLTRGKAEKTWRLTQESTPGTQGSREPSASTQGPGKDNCIVYETQCNLELLIEPWINSLTSPSESQFPQL